MNHSWLRFSTNVTVSSARPFQDCILSLQELTASANSYARPERLRPFRGKIGAGGGWLRWPMLAHKVLAARSLNFDLIPSEAGTELKGQWRLLKRIRIPVGIYLGACVLGQAFELVRLVVYRVQDPLAHLIGPAISFVMIYGWTWALVVFNRRSESQLITAVKYALESDKSAGIVGDLLSLPK